jgi:hypothetical protein
MELVRKDRKGKLTHILGISSELISGIMLLGVSMLGVLWIYMDPIFSWLGQLFG